MKILSLEILNILKFFDFRKAPNFLWAQFKIYDTFRLFDAILFLLSLYSIKQIIKSVFSRPLYLYVILFVCISAFSNFILNKIINFDYAYHDMLKIAIFILFFYCGVGYQKIQVKKIADINIVSVVAFSILQNLIFATLGTTFIDNITCDYQRHVNNGLIRCATFEEGNYFSAFLLLSLVASSFSIPIVFIGWVGSLISSSPIGIVLTTICFAFVLTKEREYFSLFCFVLITTLFIAFSSTADVVFSKIYFESFREGNEGGSALERLQFIIIGFKAFFDNIYFGVGPGQFTYQIEPYSEFSNLAFRAASNERLIANNSYAELLSQYGLSGFAVIIVFILRSANRLKSETYGYLRAIIILVVYCAFPSFWLGWNAFILGLINYEKKTNYP